MTLEELISEINRINNFNLIDSALKKYNGDDWRKYEYEIYLIIWDYNSKTPIHDHADNGCWLKVLDGKIHEKKYSDTLNLLYDNVYENGDISYMNNNVGFHSIINSDKISYTLHVYSPPNHKTIYFSL